MTSNYSAWMSKTDIWSSFLISESGKTNPTEPVPSEQNVKTGNMHIVVTCYNIICWFRPQSLDFGSGQKRFTFCPGVG